MTRPVLDYARREPAPQPDLLNVVMATILFLWVGGWLFYSVIAWISGR